MAEVVMLGADGGVSGGANIFPTLYVNLYNAASTGNIEKVKRLQVRVVQISATIYNVVYHGSNILKGVKCSLSILGICNDFLAAPLTGHDTESRKKIAKAIDDLQLINIKE